MRECDEVFAGECGWILADDLLDGFGGIGDHRDVDEVSDECALVVWVAGHREHCGEVLVDEFSVPIACGDEGIEVEIIRESAQGSEVWEEHADHARIFYWVVTWRDHRGEFRPFLVFSFFKFETEFNPDDWAVGGLAEAFELGREIAEELSGFFVVWVVQWDLRDVQNADTDPIFQLCGFFSGYLAGRGFLRMSFPQLSDFFVDWPRFLVFGVGVVLGVDGEYVVLGDVGVADVEAGGESCVGDEDEEDDGGDGASDGAEGAPVEGALAFGGSAEEFGDFLWVAERLGDLVWGAPGLECVLGVGDEFLGDLDAFGLPELCFVDGCVDEGAELFWEICVVQEFVGL